MTAKEENKSVVWIDYLAAISIIVGFLFVFDTFGIILYGTVVMYLKLIKDGIYGRN